MHGGDTGSIVRRRMAESERGLAAACMVETAFQYPEGYAPPDASAPVRGPFLAVRAVEPAGEGPVLYGTVRDTHALFLTAGVLCAE